MVAETMLAVRSFGPRDYRVDTVPVPVPGPGEVLIEVGACGICASDMKCWLGGEVFWGKPGQRGYVDPGVIAGHEYGGVVVALGEGASERHGVQLGDRVVAEQIVPCNACRYCRNNQYWMCQQHNIFGFKSLTNGGMARYNLYPANALVHKVPTRLTDGEVAYIEPAACAWHAIDRAEIQPGDTVVISGVGNIGLCMVQIAALSRPGQIIALDVKPYRLELARRLGANVAINVADEDPVQTVRNLTDGYGCDVFIEASGNPATIEQGLNMVRKLGTFVEFSVFNEPTTLNWTIIGDTKELTIHGSHLGPFCYPKTIQALADGRLNVKPLLAGTFPLTDFAAAMQASLSGTGMKNLIIPV